MIAQSEFDFLLSAASTHELYMQHVTDGPSAVAQLRRALREDARVKVRRNALVALSASRPKGDLTDALVALDDPAPQVLAEGAAAIASGADAMGVPENAAALAALRSRAEALRAALASVDDTARYNAALALRVVADPQVDLSLMLRDDLLSVRTEGLRLAGGRKLSAAELDLLDAVARTDADAQLRARAVSIAAYGPAETAAAVVSAALRRGDVDRSVADAVKGNRLSETIPAILVYLRTRPERLEWLETLTSFGAPCTARAIAGMLTDYTAGLPAQDALRRLSGHPEWNVDQLKRWATAQSDDAPPCKAHGPKPTP